MKVGVLLSSFDTHTGGSHTLEAELCEALVRCASQCSHTFLVLTKGQFPAHDASNIQVEHLTGGRRMKERLLAGVSAVATWPARWGQAAAERHAPTRWLERVIVNSGVDVMWYLTPGAATTQVPYLTVVWDLQHRRQPFFPEVSAEMQWERRERFYRFVSLAAESLAGIE